jgi:hypothetical protein
MIHGNGYSIEPFVKGYCTPILRQLQPVIEMPAMIPILQTFYFFHVRFQCGVFFDEMFDENEQFGNLGYFVKR